MVLETSVDFDQLARLIARKEFVEVVIVERYTDTFKKHIFRRLCPVEEDCLSRIWLRQGQICYMNQNVGFVQRNQKIRIEGVELHYL
jgi:hypothetical protein